VIAVEMPPSPSGFGRLPIRLRLTIAFAGVLALALAVGVVGLYTEFERDLDDVIDQDLDSRVADMAALLRENVEPDAALAGSGERVAQVFGTDGRRLASTRAVSDRPILTRIEARRAARDDLGVDRRPTAAGDVRVRAVRARLGSGTTVAVAVGDPLASRDESLERLLELLLIAAPLALLLASYAGYQVAGAALRPVERMRAGAERITEQDTSQRLPVVPTSDEIGALGRTLNELLTRLDAALTRERRLLADASHELRTPLTVLRAEVQVALRGERDAHELRAALESVGEESERLSRLADDLLVLARADQGRLPVRSEPVDAAELIDAAAGRASAGAGALGRTVLADVEPAGTIALADPDRTGQALDNLVANALAHGRGDVRLAARRIEGRVELHVTDEGDGFPAELLPRAFERFSQGDPARSGEGTGLGLAIVAAIARAHGGDAGARNLPGGGADVWISLPAGPAASPEADDTADQPPLRAP
jgi:two-component system OmpR family sensor kinase